MFLSFILAGLVCKVIYSIHVYIALYFNLVYIPSFEPLSLT